MRNKGIHGEARPGPATGTEENAYRAANPQLIEAIIGCLLHDIGKPVQRAALGYPGGHSAVYALL